MKILQTQQFKKAYKRLHPNQKPIIDNEIKKVIATPTIGAQKKQDLSNIFVHKFKVLDNLYLLAYTFDPKTLTLVLLGVHENFYRDMKNFFNNKLM